MLLHVIVAQIASPVVVPWRQAPRVVLGQARCAVILVDLVDTVSIKSPCESAKTAINIDIGAIMQRENDHEVFLDTGSIMKSLE
jgi:hypothetical protein